MVNKTFKLIFALVNFLRSMIWGVSLFGILLAGLGTIFGFLGQFFKFLELASNLRLQYTFLLGIGTLISGLYKKPRVAISAGFLTLVNLSLIYPFYKDTPRSSLERDTHIYRALLINVYWKNENYEKVIESVRNIDPDLIMLLEATPEWMLALRELSFEYPFVESEARRDPGGIALISRSPLEGVKILDFGVKTRSTLIAQIKLDEQILTVIGFHPYASRINKFKVNARQKQLKAVAQFVAAQPYPVLLLADLNFTPWSPLFHELIKISGLHDGRNGFGVKPTWPVNFPPLLMPIDHCLTSPQVIIYNYQTKPIPGSDHHSVVVDFSIRDLNTRHMGKE